MKTYHFALNLFAAALLLIVVSPAARSQTPPPVMSHQGRVSVDGVNFDGIGRFKFALVDDTGDVTYWSHDGTSVAGASPDSDIELPVTKGLYAVLLGDPDISTNMTEPISASVFTNPDVRLRVWFDDGDAGVQQLTPDRRLAAVGYAMMAGNLADGAWHLAGNTDTTPGTHFVGTTDDQPLELHVNGQRVLRLEPDETSPRLVGGHPSNTVSGAGAVVGGGGNAGGPNTASGNYATVGGGLDNTADNWYATIGGGLDNIASGAYATVGGGVFNTADNWYATIGGGSGNTASGQRATVPGGRNNTANGDNSFAAGGRAKANHDGTFVWADSTIADFASETSDEFAVRAAGGMRLDAPSLTLVGTPSGTHFVGTTNNQPLELHVNGQRVLRLEPHATSPRLVGGHPSNTVSGTGAVVGGGGSAPVPNTASGSYTTVGGGSGNTADNWAATSGGGQNNTASSAYATVGGGSGNTASDWETTVGGGAFNTANGRGATVGGGRGNIADNWSATVPGGRDNTAAGSWSFAAGRRAKANHDGAFVWGDSTNDDVTSSASDQVTFLASGGYRIFSNSDTNLGVRLDPNATSWSIISDRQAKENFAPIDPVAILEQLAELPVTAWNYKADPEQRRHIGPVAQDFHAAFDLGDDKTITTLDADGIAFAAIQGVNAKFEDRMAALESENARLSAENERLTSEIEAIKRHLGL